MASTMRERILQFAATPQGVRVSFSKSDSHLRHLCKKLVEKGLIVRTRRLPKGGPWIYHLKPKDEA